MGGEAVREGEVQSSEPLHKVEKEEPSEGGMFQRKKEKKAKHRMVRGGPW